MQYKKTLFSLLIMLILIFSISLTNAQNGDDPNLDQMPKSMRGLPPVQTRQILAPVTSSDGYDNFFLGVDFAEPHISSSPVNPLWIFAAYNSTTTVGTHYTLNAFDWLINNPTMPSPAGDPATAYDSLGYLYFQNMYGSTITGCYVVTSTNNGVSWSTPVWAINGNDKNWMAADQSAGPYSNYIYTTMTAGSGYGNFARSTDRGQTFIQTANFNTQSLPGMMVCVGPKVTGGDVPGGYVYVVTNSGSAVAPYYYFYRSTDGGTSFSLATSVQYAGYLGTYVNGRPSVQNMRTRPYPFIAADNSYGAYRGRLYLVYATNVPNVDGGKSDILCRYSTDAGTTWSSPVTVNDDANTVNNYQWFPAIWTDKETGKLYVKWYDTRNCPTSDSSEVYASYSTNGGVSFVTNQKISNAKMKINCTTCGGGGTPAYLGDYDAITSNKFTSTMAWTDFRAGSFGSYTAFFPDFAMKTNPTTLNSIGNNDSTFLYVTVPSVKLYTDKVKFTAVVTPTPASGSIALSFVNGKDSLTNYPDSVRLRIKTVGTVTPGSYSLAITGKGTNGTPVHKRTLNLNVNAYVVSVGTNREGTCSFKVNGTQYNTRQNLVFNAGSVVTVQAVSPTTVGGTRYVFQNWSDGGDTTHNITVNGPLSLTASYKTRYLLIISTAYGNPVGGGQFYDSAVSFSFGVYPRIVYLGQGNAYQFRGWNGSGTGSYTSIDSLGNDTIVTLSIKNPIVETARWTYLPVGIQNIGNGVPDKFMLHQNYPNPFNPSTNIKFDVAKTGMVTIKIYDILGREVTTLANEIMQPGYYSVPFNISSTSGYQVSSGVYFCKISASGFTDIKKMLVTK
ncbi:MAG: T9SS type A sorting domain-containing protein [Ignavibacteriae bacterium]|nr:T9SS type A sorting domain-containing protein [Ignavibacteriota bacterium]